MRGSAGRLDLKSGPRSTDLKNSAAHVKMVDHKKHFGSWGLPSNTSNVGVSALAAIAGESFLHAYRGSEIVLLDYATSLVSHKESSSKCPVVRGRDVQHALFKETLPSAQ